MKPTHLLTNCSLCTPTTTRTRSPRSTTTWWPPGRTSASGNNTLLSLHEHYTTSCFNRRKVGKTTNRLRARSLKISTEVFCAVDHALEKHRFFILWIASELSPSCLTVLNGVPQGSVLGPLSFSYFNKFTAHGTKSH